MNLRDYQSKAIEKLRISFSKGNNKVLLSLVTGGGKTLIAKAIMEMAINKSNRVLFTVNRNELINQTVEKFESDFNISVVKGSSHDNTKPIQISTIQTLNRRDMNLNPNIILIDEVHWGYKGKMLKNILAKYPNSKIIGLTATPICEKGYLLEGFDDLVEVTTVNNLINQNFLVDVKCYEPVKLDLKNIKNNSTNTDFDPTQLNDNFNNNSLVANIVEEWGKLARYKKTLVFAISIEHSFTLKDNFKQIGVSAEVVTSKTPKKDRVQILEDFKINKIQVLINVEILTTGFDEPSVECILMARPTKTLRLYLQMVGRGLRLFKGKKECLFLDCANTIKSNGYPTVDRIFNKKEDVLKIKKQIQKSDSSGEYECEKCEHSSQVSFFGVLRNIKEDGTIENILKCPNCEFENIVSTIKPNDGKLEEIKKPQNLHIDIKNLNTITGVIQELEKIREIKNYKSGWVYMNSKKILKNLDKAKELFNECNIKGYDPTYALLKLDQSSFYKRSNYNVKIEL